MRRCRRTRLRLFAGVIVLKPTRPAVDGSAVTPRCPSCGARVPADATWCGQCHQSLTRQPQHASTPPAGQPSNPASNPAPRRAEPLSAATLTGGTLPEEVLDDLVGRLAAQESVGPIAGLGRFVRGPARQAALAVVGFLIGVVALLAGMWVLGQVLSG